MKMLDFILGRDPYMDYRKRAQLPPFVPLTPPALAPQSATTVGRLVVMLDRSYGNYDARRSTLEAEIAERTEELRQVNAALASLGAALLAAAEDPALTDDERAKAEAPIDAVASIEGLDLTDPHQFEKYPPHSPERWMDGLSGMVAPRNEVTDAV